MAWESEEEEVTSLKRSTEVQHLRSDEPQQCVETNIAVVDTVQSWNFT